LGVSFVTLTSLFSPGQTRGIKQGAYVSIVAPVSPAEAAGLKTGDIITAIKPPAA